METLEIRRVAEPRETLDGGYVSKHKSLIKQAPLNLKSFRLGMPDLFNDIWYGLGAGLVGRGNRARCGGDGRGWRSWTLNVECS